MKARIKETDYEGEGAHGKLCKIVATGETL